MLPETGATELIFLAAVALIVVGPKDLPVLMRKVGQFTAKVRGMAAEFRASFDELARQSELDELRKEVDDLRRHHYSNFAYEPVDTFARDLQSEVSSGLEGAADLHEGEIAQGLLPFDQPAAAPAPSPAPSAPEPLAPEGRTG